ncbi:hypothetical protein BGZ61DRAFT_442075 [Ilyonectria robusta]|uniref:uncharacterized protein n=1 Tax=Ilyonectria robusta TaxID=1079257 RepID=UPI001E8DEAAB|nr:uncharacterized protein BGZ61DRAFT_442075 [Ilyonectria robusta]KAH8736480.1 hypothetical protein BGZ61DRAFT_442075 [Ilyonectria robusta]
MLAWHWYPGRRSCSEVPANRPPCDMEPVYEGSFLGRGPGRVPQRAAARVPEWLQFGHADKCHVGKHLVTWSLVERDPITTRSGT